MGRPGQGTDRDRQHRARRPRDRAQRRDANLQFLRRCRRYRHAHHARHPRRRPRQQHAAANQPDARAGGRSADLRALADGTRRRWHKTVQTARRGRRHAVCRGGLSARGHGQLSRKARLVAWRRRDIRPRRARAMVRCLARQPGAGEIRRGQITMAQPRAHQAPHRSRPWIASRAVLAAIGSRSGRRPRSRGGRGAAS